MANLHLRAASRASAARTLLVFSSILSRQSHEVFRKKNAALGGGQRRSQASRPATMVCGAAAADARKGGSDPTDVGYSRFDASDFVILDQIGEIKFGKDAPTTVFVGGGSSIRLYAARLNPDRAKYEPGDVGSQILVLKEHTRAAGDLGRREWAAYQQLGIDNFSVIPSAKDPTNFAPVIGTFVTQTVAGITEDELSVWTVTRYEDLDRTALGLARAIASRNYAADKIKRIYRRICAGAVSALLTTHTGGLAHGGLDASAVVIVRGGTDDDDLGEVQSGLSSFGYCANLNAKTPEMASPYLTAATLAGSAGRRGLDKDPVLAGVVARKEDMRRLGIALLEILIEATRTTPFWQTTPKPSSDGSPDIVPSPSALGTTFPLGGGTPVWDEFRKKAQDANGAAELCAILSDDGDAGWDFLGLLLGMNEGDNPLLQLTRAESHPFVA
uniref:Protein kinase domain-containing protein n=1 Tax=Lotharella globosa TaxID=91324 RepID=A0A7S3YUF6_9EUKA